MIPARHREWLIVALACVAMLLLPAVTWLLLPRPAPFVATARPAVAPSLAAAPEPARSEHGAETRRWGSTEDTSPRDEPVRGVVLDPDGHPLRGAAIACEDREPAITASSGEDGRFELPPEGAGCSAIAKSSDFFPSDATTLRAGANNTLRLLGGGAIDGEVVDEANAPLTTYVVSVESYRGPLPDRAPVRQVRTIKDPRGAFTWDRLPRGSYVLTASAEGRPPAHSESIEVDGAHPTRARITLAHGAILRGQITDAVTHRPIAGAVVALDGLTTTGAQSIIPTTADDQGNYVLEGVPAGPFSIRVSHDGHRARVVPGLRTGGAPTIRQDVDLNPFAEGGPRGDDFAGIGAFLVATPNGVSFGRLVADGPAEKSGVVAGDVVRRIDGADASSYTVVECMQNLRGPDGSRVTVQVDRGGRTVDITIQRGALTL